MKICYNWEVIIFIESRFHMNFIRSINRLFNDYLAWIVLAVAVIAFLVPSLFIEAAKQTVPLLQ